MTPPAAYDAVLLLGFGGPEGPDEVLPFLQRVTAGRGIPDERLLEVGEHYLALGGVSPINEQNRALTAAVATALAERGITIPVVLGNRNAAPFFSEALAGLHAAGHRRILGLPTSAYSSYSGCRQYRDDIARALDDAGLADEVVVRKLPPFGHLPGFIDPVVDDLRDALGVERSARGHLADVRVLFTTHSLPVAMQRGSGPGGCGAYLAQHLEVAERIMAAATDDLDEQVAWSLVFQSRSGPPGMPWLEPDVNDEIRQAAAAGVRSVVVAPIGFISDHVEVIWDLDTQARQTAQEEEVDFRRIRTPGIDPRFVAALADLVAAEVTGSPSLAPAPVWAGLCGADCCLPPARPAGR